MDGYYATLRLYREKPEYIPEVRKCIKAHHAEKAKSYTLGFQWTDVEVQPVILHLLVTKYGLLVVPFKSNNSTCYLVKDIEGVEKALKDIDSKKIGAPTEGTMLKIYLSAQQRKKLKAYIDAELSDEFDPETMVAERALNEFLDRWKNPPKPDPKSESGPRIIYV